MKWPMKVALGITLALTAYTAWLDAQDPQVDPNSGALRAVRPDRNVDSGGAVTGASVAQLAAAAAATPVDVFNSRPWLQPLPPPPPPKTYKSPPPQAPPLPFDVAGQWREGMQRYIVIAAGDQQFLLCSDCETLGRVRPGDVLLDRYRLDAIGANELNFTYLPLEQRQSLSLGGL